MHILLDSFSPRISKMGQADILTFKGILDYYKKELERYFDINLFEDLFRKVEEKLKDILKDIANEHKVSYRELRPENIIQIELYYDSKNVNWEKLNYIKEFLEKLKEKGIKIIEKDLNKMDKKEIEELAIRLIKICTTAKISCRTSRRYTIAKELLEFGTFSVEDPILIIVKYKKNGKEEEIFYPHTPSRESRFNIWIKPEDFIEYLKKLL